MRIIKLGLISFAFLAILILLISLLFPSHVRLSKATNLPNDRERIFALLQNDTVWHPAYRDTATVKAMTELNQKLLTKTDSTLVLQLQAPDRKPVINGYQLYGTPQSDSLTLQWYMDFTLSWYPWEKFSSLFFERTYGAMMEQGLVNFKKKLTRAE